MPLYQDIKAADAALNPSISDPDQAAAALNAQTVAAPYMDVSVGSIAGILLLAPTGDWDKLQARAAATLSGSSPPTQADQAISLAKRAMFLLTTPQISIIHAADFPAFATMLGILVAIGDISAASQSAILALGQPFPTVPRWNPPLNAGDIQTARAQP